MGQVIKLDEDMLYLWESTAVSLYATPNWSSTCASQWSVRGVSQLSLSLPFMRRGGCLGNSFYRSVNVRWVFDTYRFFCNFHFLSPSRLAFLCHSLWAQKEFQTSDSDTETAGKATAGAPTRERLTMTFDKQHCQHITSSRVVEKEYDRRCKWGALFIQGCVSEVWCHCKAANAHILSGVACVYIYTYTQIYICIYIYMYIYTTVQKLGSLRNDFIFQRKALFFQ